jgi:hypothetical protein
MQAVEAKEAIVSPMGAVPRDRCVSGWASRSHSPQRTQAAFALNFRFVRMTPFTANPMKVPMG